MITWLKRRFRELFHRRAGATIGPSAPPAGESAEAPDLRRVAERLLEDEALTADLVDPAARYLLEWAIAQVNAIFQETEGMPTETQARLAALYQRIQAIARRAGQSPPDEQLNAVQKEVQLLGGQPGDLGSQ